MEKEENRKRIPIGIENYKALIGSCYYVDKTMILKDLVDSPLGTSYLFTRPRRFGKSLTLSMIQTFFEAGEDPAPYFADTAIMQADARYHSETGVYPVIHLNFKDIKADCFDEFLSLMRMTFEKEKERHHVASSSLPTKEPAIAEEQEKLPFWLSDYMGFLRSAYGKEVIVLVDEYDTPIEEAYRHGYYDQCVSFFRKMLGSALKGNDSLRFSVLTGVLRIGKESLFSDLNNLVVNSTTDRGFGEYFGFTEEEVEKLLAYYGYSNRLDEIRAWYDGYYFGDISVYNPWSVLCFIQNRGLPKAYWANTAENPFIGKLLSTSDLSNERNVKSLLEGTPIRMLLPSDVSFPDIGKDETAIYSLLLSSGYLTAKSTGLLSEYELFLPNEEIKTLFRYEVLQRYAGKDLGWLSRYRATLESGTEEEIGDFLKDKLLSLFSPFDFSSERNYQALLLGFMAALYDDYLIQDEFNSGEGRADLILIPKNKGSYGYIYELKQRKGPLSNKRLKSVSEKALVQIEEKDYAEFLRKAGVRSYVLYGVAFAGKSVQVSKKEVRG